MTPDSVRLALGGEAETISAVQRRAWQQTMPPELVDEILSSVTLAEMTASWQAAILRPPLAQLRVLVALGQEKIVGFAAIGPSNDPDAEAGMDGLIGEFAVDPSAQRRGHGSRLLHACIDTLRADGFTRATWWVGAGNDILREFLESAGWASDGAHTEVAVAEGGSSAKLVRLHTVIA